MSLWTLMAAGFLAACGGKSMRGMIVFTQVEPEAFKIDSLTGGTWKYVERSRIVALDPNRPGVIAGVLTPGFVAARSPEISFDGNRMLFTGRKNAGDRWKIYEMNLENHKVREVIARKGDCTDPSYLPGNRIIFSSLNMDAKSKAGHTLYTCGLNGCCLSQVTYHPNSDFSPSVLHDGRVVAITWPVYPRTGKPIYLSFRPDGTKLELYYNSEFTGWLPGKVRETDQGQIVFVESGSSSDGHGKLVSLSKGRPLSSRAELPGEEGGSFYSVYPGAGGKLLVSYHSAGSARFGIYEYNPELKKMGKRLYSDDPYNSIEPVLVTAHQRPRDLPSEIVETNKSGLVMCMNSDNSTLPAGKNEKTESIRILGLGGPIQDIPVEPDGSFYIDLSANRPVQIETLGKSGEVLRGPCAWIWIRPNERRGCIGCHEEKEMAPENKVVDAIKKMPVKVPIPGTTSEGKSAITAK